ncbi:uncharacterized protein LOC126563264 [Anopheles maculipalpis]|uniref:uncharacterized protein LOC126563264 n=1 Tax=Anopheles maculipalpis TaxID=1496333 RepID=UPI002159B070|nr:uncharacterized protein LOC126563264 [Anopheles maculipalpis]
MALPTYLNFTNNIRTHAYFVGAIMTLDTICTLLLAAAWNVKAEQLPEDLQFIAKAKEFLLVVGIVHTLITIVYWVGFLKRQRWCLTLFIGILAISITLQFIGFLGAILQLQFVNACVVLIGLAISGYFLLVTLQLRKVNSESLRSQDGFSA